MERKLLLCIQYKSPISKEENGKEKLHKKYNYETILEISKNNKQRYKRNGKKVVAVYSVQIPHFTVGDAGRQGPRPNTLHIW